MSWPLVGAISKDENPGGAGCAHSRLVHASPVLRLMPGAFPAPRTVVPCARFTVSLSGWPRRSRPLSDEARGSAVDGFVERCAGIDIGKREVVACVRTPGPGGRGQRKQTRTFVSFTGALEEMADWFLAEGVTEIAMEATGPYWYSVAAEVLGVSGRAMLAALVALVAGERDPEGLAELARGTL